MCGKASRSDISGVSIRSALFALKNNGVITDAEFKELDRSWTKHKKKNGLDAHGRKVAPKSTEKPVTENTCGDGHGH